MRLYYLEIVSHDAAAVRKTYEALHAVTFSEPDELLGGAIACVLSDGSRVGIREPLRETETPVVRPYWQVDDIGKCVAHLETLGATIAVSPLEIPGKGTFAIYLLGANDHGLWQPWKPAGQTLSIRPPTQ